MDPVTVADKRERFLTVNYSVRQIELISPKNVLLALRVESLLYIGYFQRNNGLFVE